MESYGQKNVVCETEYKHALQLMESDRYKEAISLIDEYIAKGCTDARLYNLKGCALIHSDVINDEINNKKAIVCFKKAIERDSLNCFYFSNIGWAYQNIDNWQNCYASYKKAALLDSNHIELHQNVLRFLFFRNRNKEAMAYCNYMIKKFPSDGYAYYVRGNLKRDYLHKYPEGNKDIKLSEEIGWRQGMLLFY